MAEPLNSRITNEGHRIYKWKDDKQKFYSVTTIIGNGLPKPQLVNWAAKMAAKRAVEIASSLEDSLENYPAEKIIDYLKNAHTDYTFTRAAIGTIIHSLCEEYILTGKRPRVTAKTIGIVETTRKELNLRLDQFEKFIDTWNPKFTHTEKTVFSRQHGYAGTFDIRAIINRVPLIMDIKSGKSVWKEAAYQMSAYTHADFMVGDDGEELPVPRFQGGVILQLSDTNNLLYPVDVGDRTFSQFLRLRDTFRFEYEESEKIKYRSITPKMLTRFNSTTPEWVKEIWQKKK